jgi:eukaryotic-like serine/threonine-protein kinase
VPDTRFLPLRADEPRAVSGYVLEARIGEGGMGTVYLSRTRGGRPVALKLIRREYAANDEFRRRFAREVEAAQRVYGPHVAPVLDHGTDGDRPWLATRYIPGVPLDDALAAHGPLPAATVLHLLACAARALDAVHSAGVIHRDVKPGNLLLAADGPWLLDFGIARAAGAVSLTTTGRLVGTPKYMSPEHALGRELTPAADIFALGLLAGLAATGRHPYGRGNALAVAARIAGTDREPPDLTAYPGPLRHVLQLCLSARPELRPSAAGLAELCRKSSGRGPQDFEAWLPPPHAAAVDTAERAAHLRLTLPTAPTAPMPVRDRPHTGTHPGGQK